MEKYKHTVVVKKDELIANENLQGFENRNVRKLGKAILISSCDFSSFYLLTVIIKDSRIAHKKNKLVCVRVNST